MEEDGTANLTGQVDDDARTLGRRLTRSSRSASLSFLRANDGFPAVSRVICATDFVGRPVLLVSALSLHAAGLRSDPRCALLLGETGKGDPLAHPRITLSARAHVLERDMTSTRAVRARFLSRQPKSKLYADFPDFSFVALDIETASLNGGFAKAYTLTADDLLDPLVDGLEGAALRAVDHMNADHADAIAEIAGRAGESSSGWRIATADRRGFEIRRSDSLRRIEFRSDPAQNGGYRQAFVELLS